MCQARRFVLLMERIYGKRPYAKSGHPNWNVIAKKPTFRTVPKQGMNQCGFYCLKNASSYDGEKVVEDVADNDVCIILTDLSTEVPYHYLKKNCC